MKKLTLDVTELCKFGKFQDFVSVNEACQLGLRPDALRLLLTFLVF